MIDVKATLEKAGMTPYRLAKELGRHRNQIYTYVNGKNNPSPMMQEKLTQYFEENAIEIVKKG